MLISTITSNISFIQLSLMHRITEKICKERWQHWCTKISGVKVLPTLLISTITSNMSFIRLSLMLSGYPASSLLVCLVGWVGWIGLGWVGVGFGFGFGFGLGWVGWLVGWLFWWLFFLLLNWCWISIDQSFTWLIIVTTDVWWVSLLVLRNPWFEREWVRGMKKLREKKTYR